MNLKKQYLKQERKLYNYIMMPAMLLSWLFGILLIHSLGFSVFELWMQVKTALVIILTFYHFMLGKYLREFAIDNNISLRSILGLLTKCLQ